MPRTIDPALKSCHSELLSVFKAESPSFCVHQAARIERGSPVLQTRCLDNSRPDTFIRTLLRWTAPGRGKRLEAEVGTADAVPALIPLMQGISMGISPFASHGPGCGGSIHACLDLHDPRLEAACVLFGDPGQRTPCRTPRLETSSERVLFCHLIYSPAAFPPTLLGSFIKLSCRYLFVAFIFPLRSGSSWWELRFRQVIPTVGRTTNTSEIPTIQRSPLDSDIISSHVPTFFEEAGR